LREHCKEKWPEALQGKSPLDNFKMWRVKSAWEGVTGDEGFDYKFRNYDRGELQGAEILT